MRKTISAIAIIGMTLISGCTLEKDGILGTALRFSSQVEELSVETEGTKGSYKTVVSTFVTRGYGSTSGSEQWFPSDGGDASITLSSNPSYPEKLWETGESHIFLAYANVPVSAAVASAAIASDGVTLTYTAVPAAAGDQPDMLLGRYIGDGDGKGLATITFYHPLTSVRFVQGDLDGGSIRNISIEGVYTSGEVTLAAESGTPDLDSAWSNTTGSGTVSGNTSDNFLLIPQNLAAKSVILRVTLNTGGNDFDVLSIMDTGNWKAGKVNTYTIEYTSTKGFGPGEPVISQCE